MIIFIFFIFYIIKNEEAMLSAMVDVAESLVTDMFQAKACFRKIFAVLVLIAVLAANCYKQFMLFKRFLVARGKVKILKSEN